MIAIDLNTLRIRAPHWMKPEDFYLGLHRIFRRPDFMCYYFPLHVLGGDPVGRDENGELLVTRRFMVQKDVSHLDLAMWSRYNEKWRDLHDKLIKRQWVVEYRQMQQDGVVFLDD